jgi:hypothetical protein
MAELGSGNGTSYPAAIDTDNTLEVDNTTTARADVPNDMGAAIVAIETELGTDPAGSVADVKTFLQAEHETNGTHGAITPTSMNLNTSTKTMTKVLDEDNMATDSDTSLATQQSIKAYVDAEVGKHGIVQQVFDELRTATSTAGTALPVDNTIPQDNEGDEITALNNTFTPTSATNAVLFEINLLVAVASVGVYGLALFDDNDGSNNALVAWAFRVDVANNTECITYRWRYVPGVATERDYRLRIGTTAGAVVDINEFNTAQVFNGKATSNITISEIEV